MVYALGQLLTRTAARVPDRDAVVYKARAITYRELETTSNQLARLLMAHGIRKGDRVGICLNKSIESIVAVFGILKAGAAYVPLDPAAPAKRLGFIINNCGMTALVSTRRNVADLRQTAEGASPLRCVVLADAEAALGDEAPATPATVTWPELAQMSADPPAVGDLIEDDLAYILYTSGSTGEPKGVMISHRASLTFVNWAYECFGVRPSDRLSNHAPLHFDLSIFDIFAAIKGGATIVPVPEELSIFPIDLARFIESERITVWYSVPSVLTRLVLYGDLGSRDLSSLRQILFAGEVFPIKYLRQLMDLVPRAAYFNLYGPTETNVCTYHRVDQIAADRTEPVPIGRACANTEAFAVTEQSELAGPEEVGELYVRGPGLMKGYWGSPEKTAEVLVPHPTRPAMWDEHVYRTGDLVKQDRDGNYLFVGRRDNMIKSRGYRIELGEIETVLYGHPSVEEATVIAMPDDEIGTRIQAVVVARGRARLTAAELQRHCAARIPRYMVPELISFRGSLPKTSTGKVDRPSLVRERLEEKQAAPPEEATRDPR